jgi:muconolactone delta-isomerase
MKILLISKTKDVFYVLAPEVRKQLHDEQEAFLKKYAKEGKLKEIYNLVGCNGAAAIWEVDSAEEGELLFNELPTYPYIDIQLYILTEYSL